MHEDFTNGILSWYAENKRYHPWESSNNPYHIWLREVIFQQTRIEQGIPYYHKFIKKYPTIQSLANAALDDIYKDWEGLGYYTRARNLHAAAGQIVQDYGGKFPSLYSDIIRLKGVGPYTAAAIASFAFRQPYAVLDGNVFRVLSRFFGIKIPIDSPQGKKVFQNLANECMDSSQPDIYNQAIMDFGAIQCTPRQPLCENCPLSSNCAAYQKFNVSDFPVKKRKAIKRPRYFNYLVINNDKNIIIQKREQSDIWKNLYQFPLVESAKKNFTKNDARLEFGSNFNLLSDSKIYRQTLSHQIIAAKFFEIEAKDFTLRENWMAIDIHALNQFSFPKIIRDYLRERFYYLY